MNIGNLQGHVPKAVIDEIPMVVSKFEINTPLRLAHFLAQLAHESGGFRSVFENLNYSAERLKVVFPKYFKQPGLAEAYARKPELIGSRVYGSRMGNGDESSREGFRFRGRGYLQLTGKSNYAAFDKFVDEDILANPDLVATKYPLLSGAWFFHKNKINTISDRGSGEDVVLAVTKAVNGGINGLKDRQVKFNKFLPLLK